MADGMTRSPLSYSRILIVEDDHAIASLIADAIEGEIGAMTISLYDGRDAIQFLTQEPVDLVVLDYQLPGANGLQVCEAMQKLPHARAIPVLFVTANAERAGFQSRGLRCIRKPFDLAEFLDTIEHCLRQRGPSENMSAAS